VLATWKNIEIKNVTTISILGSEKPNPKPKII
jgi:hypothetical protein